jgi:carbon storage regulator CsrA
MLILNRRIEQTLPIGDDVSVTVLDVRRRRTRQ